MQVHIFLLQAFFFQLLQAVWLAFCCVLSNNLAPFTKAKYQRLITSCSFIFHFSLIGKRTIHLAQTSCLIFLRSETKLICEMIPSLDMMLSTSHSTQVQPTAMSFCVLTTFHCTAEPTHYFTTQDYILPACLWHSDKFQKESDWLSLDRTDKLLSVWLCSLLL